MIKRVFIPYLLTPSEDEDEDKSCFAIKRRNTFMCFSTTKLRFIDVINYLAPGFSYDKYLKAYGCTVQKGHFPYEYIDDLRELEEPSLPPQAKFYSSNAARRYDDGCHVSRPLLFVACSFVAQDADATTACSSAVSTHVGVL